jgi:hypothetical protein
MRAAGLADRLAASIGNGQREESRIFLDKVGLFRISHL